MSDHDVDILRALRRSLDALPDVVYALDPHGAVLHLGAAAERLYGKPMAALVARGRDFRTDLIDPADKPRVEAAYRRLENGRRLELTYNIRRADGVVGTVRERVSRKDDVVQGIVTAVRTDSQLQLPLVVRDALEASAQFFAMLDWDGHFRWVSGAFERELGLDPTALLGTHYRDLLHPEDRAPVAAAQIRDRAAPLSTRYVECRVRSGSDEWRWIAWLILPWAQRGRAYLVGVDVHAAKQAAQHLERTEAARLATYDGQWDVDLITGEIQCNARLYAMLGYAEGEIELRYGNWLNLVHEGDRERVGAAFEDHLWGEAPMYQLEHRLLRKDGSPFWVLARGQVVLREGGFTPTRMVGSYTDITERKLVEGALVESEERARCIVEAVTVPMVITRFDGGRLIFANDYARSRLGARVDTPGDFYADCPEGAGFIGALELEGRISEYELSFPQPGGVVWVIASASLIDFDGEPAVLATFSDITERRRAEDAIRERNETLNLILRTTSDGIWDWNLRTDEVHYSARWKEMLGYAPAELADRAETWRALIHPDDRPVAEQRLTDHLERGVPFEHTSRYMHKDGALRWIVVRGHALRGDDDQPLRVVGNHTDITEQMQARDERRRIETRLQNAQRLESMGVMAKGVAHDFNNMLMTILGNAELGLVDATEGSEVQEMLGEICSAARQANELCNQLLAYAGESDLTLHPLDVGEVVRDMRPLLEASISRKAHLDLDCDHELPAIRGDAGRLRQVVANVVLNASDALGSLPGTIRIATGMADLSVEVGGEGRMLVDPLPAELYVYVEIEDDGCGIAPEVRDRIFDPFFTTHHVGAGRGLGLAAALGIMRRHGGTIGVDSTLGEGSTFRLLLPIVHGADRSRRPNTPPPAGPSSADFSGQGLILFVDDRPSLRDVAQKWLESAGFQVALAADGREAVQLFEERADDIAAVALDLTMPQLEGPEVLGIMRRRRPGIPALLMSGFNDPDSVRPLAADGPVEFLQKPFAREQFFGALERLLPQPEDPTLTSRPPTP